MNVPSIRELEVLSQLQQRVAAAGPAQFNVKTWTSTGFLVPPGSVSR